MQFIKRICSRTFRPCASSFLTAEARFPITGAAIAGLAQDASGRLLEDMMRNNVFFDTCVYHLPGIELLTKVVPIDNILFGSEMVGAVRGIDPRTGHYYDDTKRYLDALPLSAEDKKKIFEGNTRRVYPRINKKV